MQTLVSDDLLEQAEAFDSAGLVLGQKDHANAVATPAAQVHAGLGRNIAQETVWDLDGEAGTVTGVLLRAGGPTVLEVYQDGECVADCLVRGAAGDVHDEAEATSVVFVLGVIQTLGPYLASLRQLCAVLARLRQNR